MNITLSCAKTMTLFKQKRKQKSPAEANILAFLQPVPVLYLLST